MNRNLYEFGDSLLLERSDAFWRFLES